MSLRFSSFLRAFMKLGLVALIFNEVRGAMMALPVIYGMYHAGGSWMAIWLGICSLGGIALSVIVPIIAARRIERFAHARLGPKNAEPKGLGPKGLGPKGLGPKSFELARPA